MFESITKRATLRLLAIASAIALFGCSQKTEVKPATPAAPPVVVASAIGSAGTTAGPLKIGFVYVGPVGDAGWAYAHDLGRKALEAEFGDKIKTTFVENVPEGADAERVFRDLAAQGNALIFGTSPGYMEPLLKVAKDFPAVRFQYAAGVKTANTVGVYDARTYEGAYLAGVIAGKVSKSAKLGVVASNPIPEVFRDINAFTLGAQSSNPKISTRVVWVNKSFDPAKERDAALALIAQGADVLIQTTDSPATLQAAEEKGVAAFGWNSDMTKIGPKAHLASSVINWSPYYTKVVNDMLAGTLKSEDSWWGIKEGAIAIVGLNPDVSTDVKTLLDEKTAAIKGGTLDPFQGPIVDQAGKKVLSAGKTMVPKELLNMNFYVKGVEGTPPK